MIKREVEYYENYPRTAKELGNRAAEGAAYCSLGIAYRKLGDYTQAIECQKQNLNINKELGNRIGEGGAYGNIGNVYHASVISNKP